VIEATLDALSALLATAGLAVIALSSVVLQRRWRAAIPLALELWMAAALLRLGGEPNWTRIASAAAIVAVRKLILLRELNAPAWRS
jgi:hypothetical protein